jgi:hypothetical protein
MRLNVNLGTSLRMIMKENAKMEIKLNVTRCCRIAGYLGDQVKATERGPIPDEALQDLPLRIAKVVNLKVSRFDVRKPDEAETSRRHWTRGSSGYSI